MDAVIPLYDPKVPSLPRNRALTHFVEAGTDYTLCGRIYEGYTGGTTPACEACRAEQTERGIPRPAVVRTR